MIYSVKGFEEIGVDWVNPRDTNSKQTHPYSYSPYYIWRVGPLANSSSSYSDRMQQWDSKKFNKACDLIKKPFGTFTREDCTKFLTEYFGEETTALGLAEGCNVSNGYPYWVFFWIKKA